MAGSWQQGEVLAWTESDGPGRPPKGPDRTVSLVVASALTLVFAGLTSFDTLCPEHRAWVVGLGGAALAGSVLAIVGLLRGWAMAPLLTLGTAAAGVGVGLLDAAHSPTRGRLIALGFSLVCLGAAALTLKAIALLRWDRSLAASLRSAAPTDTDMTLAGQAGMTLAGQAPGPMRLNSRTAVGLDAGDDVPAAPASLIEQ
jgi:hypothetical protein